MRKLEHLEKIPATIALVVLPIFAAAAQEVPKTQAHSRSDCAAILRQLDRPEQEPKKEGEDESTEKIATEIFKKMAEERKHVELISEPWLKRFEEVYEKKSAHLKKNADRKKIVSIHTDIEKLAAENPRDFFEIYAQLYDFFNIVFTHKKFSDGMFQAIRTAYQNMKDKDPEYLYNRLCSNSLLLHFPEQERRTIQTEIMKKYVRKYPEQILNIGGSLFVTEVSLEVIEAAVLSDPKVYQQLLDSRRPRYRTILKQSKDPCIQAIIKAAESKKSNE